MGGGEILVVKSGEIDFNLWQRYLANSGGKPWREKRESITA